MAVTFLEFLQKQGGYYGGKKLVAFFYHKFQSTLQMYAILYNKLMGTVMGSNSNVFVLSGAEDQKVKMENPRIRKLKTIKIRVFVIFLVVFNHSSE